MAELPNDATIEEVARVFGVEDRIGELTPAARRLTKGEMLAILGTEQTGEAVRLVATRSKPDAPTIELQAQEVGLDLTVKDIQSIESVFGTPSLPPNEQEAVRGDFSARFQLLVHELSSGPGDIAQFGLVNRHRGK